MASLAVSRIRQDFPILQRRINGHPLIYFDSAASSQKPRQVVEAMTNYYYHHHANVHRGAHTLANEATTMYEEARAGIAEFIGGHQAGIVFTRSTTEAMNIIAHSYGARLKPGDEIIITEAEHHANIVPWHLLRERAGITLVTVPLDNYAVRLDAVQNAITPRTKLISTYHMSNVTGAVNDVAALAQLAHEHGVHLAIDGAQGAPHLPVDVTALNVDFYTISGHKMLGPTGAGALYVRPELLETMPPFLGGGEMIQRVTLQESSYAPAAKRFEAGTPNIAEVIGLHAAAQYLTALGMENVAAHTDTLAQRAIAGLEKIDGVRTFIPSHGEWGGVVSFMIDDVHPHDIATALDQYGIAVRAGKHCAQPFTDALGVPGTTRASFYIYNTEEEVDQFLTATTAVRDFFRSL